ncbi:MAG: putative repeat protein (TIGR01451 family) [Hyphomicrobiaceae bacterium]
MGDVCEDDADGDGIPDVDDNCPLIANTDQADADSDGIGDVCEDADGDGIPDVDDNCPLIANTDQADADSDGTGDVCLVREACSVSLKKTHSGQALPGGELQYKLQWSNSCRNPLSNVVVVDQVPATLEVISASSPNTTATVVGNTVTFQMATWGGGEVVQGIVSVRISSGVAVGTQIDNTATVSDDSERTDSVTDTLRVRDTNEICPVTLRKVHSGNNNPGGEIAYGLQWSNACSSDLDVTVTDPLPAGLELLSASSPDGTVTIADNVATFHLATFAAGSVGKGFVTARIGDDVAPGTRMVNLATLTDGAGNDATAKNFFRVRGGSTEKSHLSCLVSAQRHVRPGRNVNYVVRYKNGSDNNEISFTLPDAAQIVDIYPPPTSQDGQRVYWGSLAATAGKVKVNTLIIQSAEDETMITGSALMDDRLGESAVCEQVSVVSRKDKLFATLKAQRYTRPGQTIRYTARYREGGGQNTMTMSLPDEVSVIRAVPPPTGGTDRSLYWTDLPVPSGVVKIDTRVANVIDGTVLVGALTVSDSTGEIVTSETQSIVGISKKSTTSVSSGDFGMSLTALRSVTPGTTTDLTVRYKNLQAPGSVQINLPPELTPVLAVPEAATTGTSATWTNLTSASGSMKLRVLVDAGAKGGRTLAIQTSGTDGVGGSASAQASTTVRESTTGGGELALSMSLARTVTMEITSDISVSYDNMQGSGQVTLTLPDGLTLSSSVPAGAQTSGQEVTWNGLTDSSASLRARVLVSSEFTSGEVLSVGGVVTDSSGASSSVGGTTTVR